VTPSAQLRVLVATLLDDEEQPGQLLALGRSAAAVGMADGTVATIVTAEHGDGDALLEHLRSIVGRNAGLHLKLCVLGGDASAQAALLRVQPRLSMRRAVQAFHLRADGSLWVGRATRRDSALGRALARVAEHQGEPPSLEVLAARVKAHDVSPERVALVREGQAFVDRIKSTPLRATPAMLAVLLAVFALQAWFGGSLPPVLVRMGASTHATLHGEPERLLAAAFLHGGIVHMGLNGYVLWILGGFLERLIGGAHLGIIVVTSAAVGGITSALLTHADLGVGASGGIWGALGAAAVLAFRPDGVLHPTVVPSIRRAAVVNLLLAGSISFLPGVDLWAHLGGGLAGAAYASAMRPYFATPLGAGHGSRVPSRAVTAIAFALAAVAVGSLAIAIARGRPWQLRQPIVLVDHALTDDVTIEVPLTASSPKHYPPDAQSRSEVWLFGDLRRDPLVVLASATPHDVPAHRLDAELEALRAEPVPVPEGAVADGPWTFVEGAAYPTLHARWIAEDLQGHMITVLHPRTLVEVDIRSFRDGPASAATAAQAVFDAVIQP
jgi:membrane associated rhomboid family serine protease